MSVAVSGIGSYDHAPSMLDYDYIVKKGNFWYQVKTDRGMTLPGGRTSSNSSLEDLFNLALVDKGNTPGKLVYSTGGLTWNINGPIQIPRATVIQGDGPGPVGKLFLENGSDCHMLEPLADDVSDVILNGINADGNKAFNAGNIDVLNWDMDTPLTYDWAMLDIKHMRLWNGNRCSFYAKTLSGGFSTLRMEDVKAFYGSNAATGTTYLERIFDAHIHRLSTTNMAIVKGCASLHIEDVYISGGDVDFGLRMDDVGTAPNYGPFENIITNMRVDNIRPGVGGAGIDTPFEIADVYWLTMAAVTVTNINPGTADDTFNAVEINNGTKGLTWTGGGVIRNPLTSGPVYFATGIKEQDTANGNTYMGLQFGDSVKGNPDNAELELLAAGNSIAKGCTREGGLAARLRYL